jgi:signal transduction histidine kinase
MLDLLASSNANARAFCEHHDIRQVLVVPVITEKQPAGLLILDCVYPGREYDLPKPEEVIIFAQMLGGLLSRARYFQERQHDLQLIALHSLGGRMNIVDGSVRALKRENLTPEGADALADIGNVLQQVRKAIRNLARLGRPSCHKTCMFSVNQLLRDAVGERQEARVFQFTLDLDASDPKVLFDREDLKETFEEIISNAYVWKKDDQPMALIHVRSERVRSRDALPKSLVDFEREYVRLSVSNQGKEIIPHIRETLFDPNEGSLAFGFRFGLARARKSLRDQEGEIIETSKAGEGAKFEIFLPTT